MENPEEYSLSINMAVDHFTNILRVETVNHGKSPVFVTAPLQRYSGVEMRPDHSAFYAFLDGGALHVTKRLWPIPHLTFVYRPEVPLLSMVRPGAMHVDEIDMDLAKRPFYPYMSVAGTPQVPFPPMVSRVIYSIGFIKEPLENLEPISVPGQKVGDCQVFRAKYGDLAQFQIVVGRAIDVVVDLKPDQ